MKPGCEMRHERERKENKINKKKEQRPIREYLRHVVQAVEDVLASLLGLDPCLTLVVLWSLRETQSRCSTQTPSHFPSGKELFTLGSLRPPVADVQQDAACPRDNPGVTHTHTHTLI